jgi:Asp-tRNA(Asn)/Glu-tRNA(Gln) amidotransferase A subunit family amidase
MEEADYQASLTLREAFTKVMKDALTAKSVMLMPLLAGAAPKAKNITTPLDKAGQKIADLTMLFAALAAMCGCPIAVLPVPPVTEGGAPWAVMLMGRHCCDAQLLQLAVRLSGHVLKTATALKKVCALC